MGYDADDVKFDIARQRLEAVWIEAPAVHRIAMLHSS
jgi:hypothetical protein